MKIFTKTILVTLMVMQISCGNEEYDEKSYSALLSTLSAFVHGNGRSETFEVIDLETLLSNGFMSPGYYPHVKEMLKSGAWKIDQPSASRVSIKIKDSFDHCSVPTAINSLAMLGVSKCEYKNNTLTVVLEK